VPDAVPLRGEARIVENRHEGGANRRLVLDLPGWPGFAPGQFLMISPGAVSAARRTDPLLPRPMAVYRECGPERIEVLYKVTGRGTQLLGEARSGQVLRVVGPLGRGFAEPDDGVQPVLVGGGTGIASLYALAERLVESHSRPIVLFGAGRASDLMGVEDFEALDADLRIATEDGSRGTRGRVTELLEAALAETGPARVYACGPTPMMRRAAEIAEGAGHACSVSLENHMACGFGVCLGCAAPRREKDARGAAFALVCRDGPVFDSRSLAWDGLP